MAEHTFWSLELGVAPYMAGFSIPLAEGGMLLDLQDLHVMPAREGAFGVWGQFLGKYAELIRSLILPGHFSSHDDLQ